MSTFKVCLNKPGLSYGVQWTRKQNHA